MFAQSARRSEGHGSSSAQSGSKLPARQREKEGGDDRDVIYAATKTDLAWEVEGAKTRGEA
jgi:hypothetical protein